MSIYFGGLVAITIKGKRVTVINCYVTKLCASHACWHRYSILIRGLACGVAPARRVKDVIT